MRSFPEATFGIPSPGQNGWIKERLLCNSQTMEKADRRPQTYLIRDANDSAQDAVVRLDDTQETRVHSLLEGHEGEIERFLHITRSKRTPADVVAGGEGVLDAKPLIRDALASVSDQLLCQHFSGHETTVVLDANTDLRKWGCNGLDWKFPVILSR